MVKRKKPATARKAKSKKAKTAKKTVKRATSGKSRRTAKKVAAKKTSRKRVSVRKPPQAKQMVPVVEGEIIDIVDEPVPGVVRVTEVETTRITVPDRDEDGE